MRTENGDGATALRRRHARFNRILLVAVLLAGAAAHATAASRYLPHLRFRVMATQHFRVYYHQGGEALAREVAAIAEEVHRELPARLRLRAPSLTHVVVADQDDAANGSAIPLPYNTITLNAAWPGTQELIGYTRDWVRLVFTHEYAHILQMDQSAGWAAGFRKILGRSPVAFPNLALPAWHIEGFATYLESRETGEGRLRAGDATTLVTERVRRIGPEPMDRYNGGSVDWPGGVGPYLYGGLFHQYLATRFGEEKLGEWSRRTSGRLHYFSAGAFRPTFGQDLPTLWKDFQGGLAPPLNGLPAGIAPRRLTRHGFFVGQPRFSADGAFLLYSVQTPHAFPSLEVLATRAGADPATLATRFGGEGASVAVGYVFFDQLELDGNVALRSDLYAARLPGGPARRLTSGARLLEPAVSPDGRRLVAIRSEGSRRDLAWFDVTVAANGPALTPSPRLARLDPGHSDAQAAEGESAQPSAARYSTPRWSPDGRHVVVERRIPMGASEIVLLDTDAENAVVLASSRSGRNMTPAWTPDSQMVLFASDREGVPQIFSVSVGGGDAARVTSVPGGAHSPEVSPDGRRLVYVGYTEDGYDLFEIPLPDLTAPAAVPETGSQPAPAVGTSRAVVPVDLRVQGYSPWKTLLPRSWTPSADTRNDAVRVGAAVGGVDVLGRHAWGATALWRVAEDTNFPGGTNRGRPDWSVGYAYDRWRPTFFASVSDETSFIPRFTVEGQRRDDAELRERQASVGARVPWNSVRRRLLLEATFDYDRHTLTIAEGVRRLARHSVRAGSLYSSAKAYGYSIGPEEGGSVSLVTEQVRRGLGADAHAQSWVAQGRWYQRAGGRHAVMALRAGVGFSSGDERVRRVFYLGGSDPAPLLDYGSEAVAMLRGVEALTYAGRRIAGGTVEYRVPLLRVNRGWRTLPLLLRTLHLAAFADAGHAWDTGFAWSDFKSSFGAEISTDVVVGFGLPLTLSAGVAWARDGEAGRRTGATPYVRLGRAF